MGLFVGEHPCKDATLCAGQFGAGMLARMPVPQHSPLLMGRSHLPGTDHSWRFWWGMWVLKAGLGRTKQGRLGHSLCSQSG